MKTYHSPKGRGRPPEKRFKLKPHDRGKLEKIVKTKSEHGAQRYQRALLLLQLAAGVGVTEVAKQLGVSRYTVNERREFYLTQGLERALSNAPGRGRKRRIQPSQEQQIVAIACTEPPAGASHWTCRLLAEEAKRRKVVDSIGHSAVNIILQRHELKPWREKNVVRQRTR
jgi:transposase